MQKLQQRRAKQSLRRDGRTPIPLVKRRKRPVEFGKRRIGHSPHRSNRMFRGYARLDIDIGKQSPARPIFAAHPFQLRIASSTPPNHAANPNSTAFQPDFFSSLLDHVLAGYAFALEHKVLA